MTYARALREAYPDLDPLVDDLFLLEAHQIEQLPERVPAPELAAVLHAHPRLRRYLAARHPPGAAFLAQLVAGHPPVAERRLAACEATVVWELADWILYHRAPEMYDERADFDPSLSAITDVVDVAGKVVVDAGAGTGVVTFAVCPTARHVFAVEPVAALRRYVRDAATRLGVGNVFVLDGRLHDIPLPASTADVLLTRQAIGWQLRRELPEIERVVKPGGVGLHLVGMPHPTPRDDDLHAALTAAGYEPGVYTEGQVDKRRYSKRFDG